MVDHQLYTDLLLDLFNLSDSDIMNVRFENQQDTSLLFVMLNPHYEPCPTCGNPHIKIKGYIPKKITHSVLSDRACSIIYKARRYVCPICKSTYYEKNPFVFNKMKISIFTVQRVLTDLQNYNETFSSVARRYNISPTSAASIFDHHVSIPRKPLSKFINFDEVYAFKSVHSKYVCVLLDYKTQTPIDVLPSRRLDYLNDYFLKIPIEERLKVEICCFDMYDTYRTICTRFFPNSICCVDHFHISQELHRQLSKIRIGVMNDIHKKMKIAKNEMGIDKAAAHEFYTYNRQYYLLKKFNWLLLKNINDPKYFDPHLERKFNKRLQENVNYSDILEEILDIDPILTESYHIKNLVADFYRYSTYDNAPEKLNELIRSILQAQALPIRNYGKTMAKWKQEIINSFKIVKKDYEVAKKTGLVAVHEYKMNNAIIENKNSIIKCIKKNSNGFTNWDRFRNRIMYVLNPNETFSLYPNEINKQEK